MYTLDFKRVRRSTLTQVAAVVSDLSERGATPSSLMLIGAHCRDVLQYAGGFAEDGTATHDIDFAMESKNLQEFGRVTFGLHKSGDTGIRFNIAAEMVNLIPFGDISQGRGVVLRPPNGPDSINVRYLSEVFQSSLELPLPSSSPIRVPSLAGYTLLKLQAFADRIKFHRYKDFEDLVLVLRWLESTWSDGDINTDLLDRAFNHFGDKFDVSSIPIVELGLDIRKLANDSLEDVIAELPATLDSQMEQLIFTHDPARTRDLVGQWQTLMDTLTGQL